MGENRINAILNTLYGQTWIGSEVDGLTILDSTGVCIRSGHHCAQPLMRRLGVSATARASFYIYNDESDVDALVAGVQQAASLFAGTVA